MKLDFSYSTDLFNYPSFSKGVARVLDTYGVIDQYNYSNTDDEADYNALSRDWYIVGYFIQNAIKDYGSNIGQTSANV